LRSSVRPSCLLAAFAPVGSKEVAEDGSPRPLNTGKPSEYSGKKYDASECGGMHS
jgi:hypothetical protein